MKKTIALLAVLVAALTCTAIAQSLLTDPPIDPAQARVIRSAENAKGLRDAIIGSLRHSVDDLWSSDYATNVATASALGTRAKERFDAFGAVYSFARAFCAAQGDTKSVAELDAIAARIPARTINPNGSVTITPPPEPTPTPTPEP